MSLEVKMSSRKKRNSESKSFLPPLSLAPPLGSNQGSAYSSRASSFLFSRHSSRHSSGFTGNAAVSPSKFPEICRNAFAADKQRLAASEPEDAAGTLDSASATPREEVFIDSRDGVFEQKLNRILRASHPNTQNLVFPKINTDANETRHELKRSRRHEKKSRVHSPPRKEMDDALFPELNGTMVSNVRGRASSQPRGSTHLAEVVFPRDVSMERAHKSKNRKSKSDKENQAREESGRLPDVFASNGAYSTGGVSPLRALPAHEDFIKDHTAGGEFHASSSLTVEKAHSDSSGSEIVVKKRHKAQ